MKWFRGRGRCWWPRLWSLLSSFHVLCWSPVGTSHSWEFLLRSSGAMEGLRSALLSLWHVSLGGAMTLLHASELVGEGGGSEDLRVMSTCFDFLSSFCAPGQERNDVPQVLVPRYMFLSLWHKDIPLFCLVAISIFWLSFKYFYHWILQSWIFMLPFNFSLSHQHFGRISFWVF